MFSKRSHRHLFLKDPIKVMTVRGTAFEAAGPGGSAGVEDAPAAGDIPKITEFIGQVEKVIYTYAVLPLQIRKH